MRRRWRRQGRRQRRVMHRTIHIRLMTDVMQTSPRWNWCAGISDRSSDGRNRFANLTLDFVFVLVPPAGQQLPQQHDRPPSSSLAFRKRCWTNSTKPPHCVNPSPITNGNRTTTTGRGRRRRKNTKQTRENGKRRTERENGVV